MVEEEEGVGGKWLCGDETGGMVGDRLDHRWWQLLNYAEKLTRGGLDHETGDGKCL